MNQNRIDQLRKKFYEGKTSAQEEAELFESGDDKLLLSQHDFYELTKGQELTETFDQELLGLLDKKEGRQINMLWTQFSKAAAILLLGVLGGILYKDSQREDVSALREELALVLSEQQSAHLRLKGLEMAQELPMLRGEMFETISQMLGSDENVNVRLAAFDVLRTSNDERIQDLLINSVMEQESFLIQVPILKYLLSFSEPKIKLELLELLKSSEMKKERKRQIENLIAL